LKSEINFRTEDIIRKIEEEGDQIALVLMTGVHYFTGQFFQIKEITTAAHSKVKAFIFCKNDKLIK
jgi:kynureninase